MPFLRLLMTLAVLLAANIVVVVVVAKFGEAQYCSTFACLIASIPVQVKNKESLL